MNDKVPGANGQLVATERTTTHKRTEYDRAVKNIGSMAGCKSSRKLMPVATKNTCNVRKKALRVKPCHALVYGVSELDGTFTETGTPR